MTNNRCFLPKNGNEEMMHRPSWLNQLKNLPEFNLNIQSFGGHKNKVNKGWSVEKESHLAYEIMVILDGEQHTIYNGYKKDYPAGSVILIPPGKIHENICLNSDYLEYFCFHFNIDDTQIHERLLLYCPDRLSEENPFFPAIKNVLNSFLSLLEHPDDPIIDRLYMEQLLIQLVIFLMKYTLIAETTMVNSKSSQIQIASTISETIRYNLSVFLNAPSDKNRKLLSIEFIAEQLNMSKSSMLKIFKKYFALSPKQYLEKLKFDYSKQLLKLTDLSISEVSETLGYQNTAQFSRQFKNWSGYSPKQFKRLS